MRQLPGGWAIKPMGDASLAIINPAEKLPKASVYSFVPMDAIADGFGGIRYLETVTEASGGYTRFRDGDILLAKITPCIENGKVARVTGLNGALGLGSTEFHVIRPADNTDGDYLFYLMSSGLVHNLAVSLMEGSTGRQRIPASIFKKRLAAPVAQDKNEQRRIAAAMKQVDVVITATQASIAAAQKLKQALMQNLLTGKLKPDGTWRRDDEFESDPKYGHVPKGWSAIKGRSVFRLHGSMASKEVQAPELTAPCFFMKVDDFNNPLNDPHIQVTAEQFDPSSTPRKVVPCQPGWIVIAKRGAAILQSRARILGKEAVLDPNLMAIEMLNDHMAEYFRYVLLHLKLHRFVEVSSIPQLNNKDMYPKHFLLPQPDEQAEVLQSLKPVENAVEAKLKKLVALQGLKTALMQNLLTGRVRIPAE